MSNNLRLSLFNYGLAANRPTTPDLAVSATFTGTSNGPLAVFYYATDTGVLSMYINGAWQDTVAGNATTLTAAATLTAKPTQVVYLDKVSGFVVTLPAAVGSGNEITVVVKTTLTSGAYEISCAGSDTFAGTIIASKTTTPTPYQATLGTTVNITLTNATVGAGIKGDYIKLKDVASGVWEVQGNTWVSGTVATPFS